MLLSRFFSVVTYISRGCRYPPNRSRYVTAPASPGLGSALVVVVFVFVEDDRFLYTDFERIGCGPPAPRPGTVLLFLVPLVVIVGRAPVADLLLLDGNACPCPGGEALHGELGLFSDVGDACDDRCSSFDWKTISASSSCSLVWFVLVEVDSLLLAFSDPNSPVAGNKDPSMTLGTCRILAVEVTDDNRSFSRVAVVGSSSSVVDGVNGLSSGMVSV